MYLSSDDETNFRSDSTAGLEYQEKIQTIDAQNSSCRIIDDELETYIMQALCNIEPEADVVFFEDCLGGVYYGENIKKEKGNIIQLNKVSKKSK